MGGAYLRRRACRASACRYVGAQSGVMLASMATEDDDLHLIAPDEIAYRLDLTPGQLKIVHTALHSLLDGLGHDEREVGRIVREVLDKLPDEHSIRAIDIGRS